MNFTAEITSRSNPSIKAAALLLSTAGRKKANRFLLEGARLCSDAAINGKTIKELYLTQNAIDKYPSECQNAFEAAEKVYLINDSVAEKLSDTGTTQQIFAVCEADENQAQIDANGMYVLAESIQNPENLGAVVRTAEALGASGIIAAGGCDIYSPKALRASMGALIRFNVIKTDNALQTVQSCINSGMRVFATVPDISAKSITETNLSGGAVCVIGNEGNGISDELKKACTDCITIPMKGRAESLNAAAAATICIWEFMKAR